MSWLDKSKGDKLSSKKVLIAYGTRYGTTEETAKDLAKILKELGIEAELVDLKLAKEKEWPSLSTFDGFLVGSGIKIGRWMKEPQKFLKKLKAEADSSIKPLGLFVSCMACLSEPEKAKTDYLEKIIKKYDLEPKIYQSFGPILDFSETSRLGRFSKSILKGVAEKEYEPAGIAVDYEGHNDLRDMDRLRKFAEEFAALL